MRITAGNRLQSVTGTAPCRGCGIFLPIGSECPHCGDSNREGPRRNPWSWTIRARREPIPLPRREDPKAPACSICERCGHNATTCPERKVS